MVKSKARESMTAVDADEEAETTIGAQVDDDAADDPIDAEADVDA